MFWGLGVRYPFPGLRTIEEDARGLGAAVRTASAGRDVAGAALALAPRAMYSVALGSIVVSGASVVWISDAGRSLLGLCGCAEGGAAVADAGFSNLAGVTTLAAVVADVVAVETDAGGAREVAGGKRRRMT